MRLRHGKITGYDLADALLSYSELGQHYVDTLKWLITHYDLDDFNGITFQKKTNQPLLR